jgi:hypothetical protein
MTLRSLVRREQTDRNEHAGETGVDQPGGTEVKSDGGGVTVRRGARRAGGRGHRMSLRSQTRREQTDLNEREGGNGIGDTKANSVRGGVGRGGRGGRGRGRGGRGTSDK